MTKISNERLAEMVGAGVACVPAKPGEIAAVVQELRGLRKAVEPFAAFASLPGINRLPDDHALTHGSPMAARQITAADFKALTALVQP